MIRAMSQTISNTRMCSCSCMGMYGYCKVPAPYLELCGKASNLTIHSPGLPQARDPVLEIVDPPLSGCEYQHKQAIKEGISLDMLEQLPG